MAGEPDWAAWKRFSEGLQNDADLKLIKKLKGTNRFKGDLRRAIAAAHRKGQTTLERILRELARKA